MNEMKEPAKSASAEQALAMSLKGCVSRKSFIRQKVTGFKIIFCFRMEGEAEAPSEFTVFPTKSGHAVLWNIYKGCGGDVARMCEYVNETLHRYADVAVDTRPAEWRQSIFKDAGFQTGGGGCYRKTSTLTFSRVPLADGSVCKDGAHVFVLSPLMDLGNAFQMPTPAATTAPQSNQLGDDLGDDDGGGEEKLGDDDDQDGDQVDRYFGVAATESTPKAATTGKQRGAKKATLVVRAVTQERFPGLDLALRMFRVFMFALDMHARHTIKTDRQSPSEVEFSASYHTHISKSDKNSTDRYSRYKQSLEELSQTWQAHNDVGDCDIRFSGIKPWYMEKCGGGVWHAAEPQFCPHSGVGVGAGDSSPFAGSLSTPLTSSTLAELEECRLDTGCHVQLLFHLGAFYEFSENGGDKLVRGLTLEVHSLAFWPHPRNRAAAKRGLVTGPAAFQQAQQDIANTWKPTLRVKKSRK